MSCRMPWQERGPHLDKGSISCPKGLPKRPATGHQALMRIRPGIPGDAVPAGGLLLGLPGGLRELFPDPAAAELAARGLFATTRSVLSHRFAMVAEDHGALVGLLIRLPGRTWRRLRIPTGLTLIRAAGASRAPTLVRRGRAQDRVIPAVGADCLYIPALVVSPDRRWQGIGTALLVRAIGEAGELGLRALVLDVDGDNGRAVRMYERSGFHRLSEHRSAAARGLPERSSV